MVSFSRVKIGTKFKYAPLLDFYLCASSKYPDGTHAIFFINPLKKNLKKVSLILEKYLC